MPTRRPIASRALGRSIRQARKRRRLTQAELAALVGIGRSTYGDLERGGAADSPMATWFALAEVLAMPSAATGTIWASRAAEERSGTVRASTGRFPPSPEHLTLMAAGGTGISWRHGGSRRHGRPISTSAGARQGSPGRAPGPPVGLWLRGPKECRCERRRLAERPSTGSRGLLSRGATIRLVRIIPIAPARAPSASDGQRHRPHGTGPTAQGALTASGRSAPR